MATVLRKPVATPTPLPAAPVPVAATVAPAPAAEGPAIPFRDRFALWFWLAAAVLMGSMLLKDLVWSVLGLR